MKKFSDVVKIKLNSNTESYFSDVEVESIKHNNSLNTLNFYLVAYNLIGRDIIKDAENDVANQLLNLNIKNDESIVNPVKFNFKYVLDEKYTCKAIYENIKKDLFYELKDLKVIYAAFFRNDNVKFLDDDTMEISFIKSDVFSDVENELTDIINDIFAKRYNRQLKISTKFVEETSINSTFSLDRLIKNGLNLTNVENQNLDKESNDNTNNADGNKNSDSNHKKSKDKNKKRGINDEGKILYGSKSKFKPRFLPITSIVNDADYIETKGIIYNLQSVTTKKGDRKIFNIYIYDGEGCIEIKFFGDLEDEPKFKNRFKIGKEILVCGTVKYDTVFSKAMVFGPIGISYIEEVSEREVIEFGKVGDEEYHNIFITDRVDEEKIKRVELHLHTKSSMQDGVGEIKAYIDTATKFGMPAMAITDHGCVNALADAYDYLRSDKRPRNNKPFKLIYGVEGYLVEDFDNYFINKNNNFSSRKYSLNDSFVLFEMTFTGMNKKSDELLKIEAIKINDNNSVEHFSDFVYTKKPITIAIRDNTGIKESDIKDADDIKVVLNRFRNFVGDSVLVTSKFDKNFMITDIFKDNGIDNDVDVLNLISLSRMMLKDLKRNDLIAIAKELKIKIEGITNRKKDELKKPLFAKDKLELEEKIFILLKAMLISEYHISDLSELKDVLKVSDEYIMRQPYYHIILLAKNDVGRVNLYKLVSDSNVKYVYNKKPRMPRSLINKYREGIIVGSACILGEFMDAIKNGASDERLKEIASFYDYLEIQPTLNNSFLLSKDRENFKSLTDLENLNKKVVAIGEDLNKLVVATCDCHYVEKSDKLYRTILRFGTTFKKTNYDANGNLKLEVSDNIESSDQEELYFRTTKEMLDEFSYLGDEKAKEVVVTNTNIINNMIENIAPLRKDKCPPHIEGSDEELKNTCLNNFKNLFGENAVPEIKDRLDNELKYIIDNGYSVMYIAAKKLIDFSVENGYPVGSRGSVGSSLAATFLGITEVNPLKPYYICPKCKTLIYDTEETKKYENDTGFDMPDKLCPHCNTKMVKDGVNIPFETFLGIPGDPKAAKEPDIDLNFCSEFQSCVHKKTVDLFGQENTFKAGTVGTVKKKTAIGYVKKYAEIEKKSLTNEQVNYFGRKILDCKNNTSQHPGGMVVLPKGEEIYSFTPIQLATSESGSDITTHYDYHKIDSNLLKLDLLGHEAPLMLKKLKEVTGIDYMTVPFYEKEVLELFESTKSLGITPNDISGTKLGCLTLPEFGTDFAMRMCEDAKPKTVADLIRIAGLAHGTDVWQGNVQDLIKNGDCTLSTAICCRDDIMIYLIEKGLDKGLAFNIMEKVRKGKGLTHEWEEEMKNHGVPDWYIGCCKKIKYMFPKAHAAAYVLAALRIAYYKVHYPKEYYATYFSVKQDGLNYRYMMQSKEDISYHIDKIKKIINQKSNDASFKNELNNAEMGFSSSEKDLNKTLNNNSENTNDNDVKSDDSEIVKKYSDMSAKNLFDLYMVYRIVEEMKSRGIDFCPMDIYKAKRSDFIVYDGKIMPSFNSIPGIGTKDEDIDYNENVAESEKSTAMRCEIEGRLGEYSSIENFSKRTKVNSTVIEEMRSLGILDGLKENDQNTVFDYL